MGETFTGVCVSASVCPCSENSVSYQHQSWLRYSMVGPGHVLTLRLEGQRLGLGIDEWCA